MHKKYFFIKLAHAFLLTCILIHAYHDFIYFVMHFSAIYKQILKLDSCLFCG